MASRRGEKIGWTVGWFGGFLWVAILSVIFLFQGKQFQGLLGLVLVAAAVAGVLILAPWRHPSTPYWKLMLLPYAMLFLSAVWAFRSFGGHQVSGFEWWSLSWLLPLLFPFGILSRRKWADSIAQGPAGETSKPHC